MRTLITFFCFALISIVFSQDLEEGLVVYYPFNWNTFDYSENEFHGITNASLTEDRFGNPYCAIHFDGYNQFLDFPPVHVALKPSLPVSFSFWIRFEDVAPFTTLILTTDYAQDKHTGAWVSTTWDGALSCGYGDGTGNGPGNRRSLNCYEVLQSNTWYYAIIVIRGSADMSIYLYCVEQDGYYEGYGGSMAYTDCQGSLGRKDSGVGYPPIYFKGALDDFKYWNRALTPEEIDLLCGIARSGETQAETGNELYLFPNPVMDFIYINALPENIITIELLDSAGKRLQSYSKMEKIQVSNLSPGIYFLRLIDNQMAAAATRKFIKE